jgi:uncharacterized protein (DUF1778 family)
MGKKNQRITIRIPEREVQQLGAAADVAGQTISEFARAKLARQLDIDHLAAALARDLAVELKAEAQAQVAALDAKLATLAADLKNVEAALTNQVNRGYFIKVTQHLSKQLAAIMSHHKIAMPKEE